MFTPSVQSGPFSRYQQILFWPLEVKGKGGKYDIGTISRRIVPVGSGVPNTATGCWERIDQPLDRGTGDERIRYAEFVYFHPFVQRFLYPDKPDSGGFELLRRTDVGRVRVSLDMGRGNQPIDEMLNVDRVHLYLFRTRIAILVTEVSADRQITRESVLALEDQFRRTYPPYWEDRGKDGVPCYTGGQCPAKVEWQDRNGVPLADLAVSNYEDAAELISRTHLNRRPPVANHWLSLLPGTASELVFEHIEDDRMPSMVYLQFPYPDTLSQGDLMRHCFYDGLGTPVTMPYSHNFFEAFEKKCLYRRYWDPNVPHGYKTLYMCCGYGFTVLVQPGFYGEIIRDHFRHHYFQLGLLAHFHRASLLRFSRRFNEVLLDEDERKHPERMREVRKEFATFVATSWFHEVSNQEQGRELFEFWTRHLGSETLMKNILTEVASVDEVLELERQREMSAIAEGRQVELQRLTRAQLELSERVDRLTKLLYGVACGALIVGFLDTETVRESIKDFAHFPRYIWWVDIAWVVFLWLVLYIFYRWIIRPLTKTSTQSQSKISLNRD